MKLLPKRTRVTFISCWGSLKIVIEKYSGNSVITVFQNDLAYNIKDHSLSMYADDHQLYVAEKSIQQVEQSLNKGGTKIS
jgi:hypothetical protein